MRVLICMVFPRIKRIKLLFDGLFWFPHFYVCNQPATRFFSAVMHPMNRCLQRKIHRLSSQIIRFQPLQRHLFHGITSATFYGFFSHSKTRLPSQPCLIITECHMLQGPEEARCKYDQYPLLWPSQLICVRFFFPGIDEFAELTSICYLFGGWDFT